MISIVARVVLWRKTDKAPGPQPLDRSPSKKVPVPGLLSNQGEKSINFFHKGSFKKKVLKYGTPKPRYLNLNPNLRYCPHTVTVYNRATIKGLIYLYYECYSTVTEWGQYPTLIPHPAASAPETI